MNVTVTTQLEEMENEYIVYVMNISSRFILW